MILVEWFLHEIQSAFADRPHRDGDIPVAAEKHDVDIDPAFTQLPLHGEAVQVRHAKVQQQAFRLARLIVLQEFPPTGIFPGAEASRIQQQLQ